MTLTTSLLLLIASLGPGDQPNPDPSEDSRQFLRAIDALQAPLQDLYCEYEGERVEEARALGDGLGLFENYSGIFKYKSKEKFIVDIYEDFLESKVNKSRRLATRSILSTESETQMFSRADGKSGRATSRHVTSSDFDVTGSYGRIFLVRSLRESLKYDKKRLVHEGSEEVDGVSCERYAIVMGRQPYSIETGLVDRFWVDMGRCGHVLRMETMNKGRLLTTSSEIKLEEFPAKAGKLWIPVEGKCRSMDGGKVVVEERYHVLKSSIRFNKGLADGEFTIRYPMGTPVSDQVKKVVYEIGQDRRPPPEKMIDAQTRLDEALKKAGESRSELVAASWSRGGWINWSFWGPFSAFLAVALVAAFAFVARTRRASP